MQSSESLSSSPPSSSPPESPPRSPRTPPLHPPIASPCAACKILRRRCVEQCVLAPYFPPSEPQKFITAHRVFGASNIIKLLQELPESQRADAVSSLVYEANARSRDPVYGCAGAIFQLQKQLSELQSQLAMAQAEILNMQTQQANFAALICMEMAQSQPPISQPSDTFSGDSSPRSYQLQFQQGNGGFFDDAAGGAIWEPLWT
ncbi:LOB domain-containing protein 1-like [Nymphaea colorata]|nr:LOB domain-containing protein 1-like [Nymphaea colorata]